MRSGARFLYFILVTVFLGYYFIQEVNAEDGPVLQTAQGLIRGRIMKSRYGKDFTAYLRIPYAEPPTGSLRLRSPVKASSWQGERDGTIESPVCIQPVFQNGQYSSAGDEDCLYISVYTPKGARSDDQSLYPVMVYIYGGQVIEGRKEETYGPNYLLDKDIIFVTFNYRQNRLGFLSMEDKHLSGNYGLKDQVMALKWIQENIESYGGNRNQVTLAGHSGGGVSVGLHMISPMSKGLFHRVIMESATPLSFWALSHKGVKRTETINFIAKVNCQNDNFEQTITCLQSLPVEKFFLRNDQQTVEQNIVGPMPFVREPEDAPEAFLTKNPWDEIKEVNEYPLLFGINSAEGDIIANPLFSYHEDIISRIDSETERYFPAMLGYLYSTTDPEERKMISGKVKKYYFGNERPMMKSFREFVELYTDRAFLQPAIDIIHNYKGEKYFYYFNHMNEHKFLYGKKEVPFGASHGEELISLFYLPRVSPNGLHSVDKVVSDQMIEYWTNFVIHGSPNSGNNKLPRWELTSTENIDYLHIYNGTLEMNSHLRKEAYDLWNGFNIKYDF